MVFTKLEFISNFSQIRPAIFVYDPQTEKSSLRCEVPPLEYFFTEFALMKKRLIYLGGVGDSRIQNTCYSFDLETLKGSTIAPMKTARVGHRAAVVKGHLYVVGGRGDCGYLNSVERFERD